MLEVLYTDWFISRDKMYMLFKPNLNDLKLKSWILFKTLKCFYSLHVSDDAIGLIEWVGNVHRCWFLVKRCSRDMLINNKC